MTRALSTMAVGLLTLSGCAPSNDLGDEDHVRTWANAASALAVFSHGYEALATADGQQSFPDAACPAVADDGTTMTITGDCTSSSGIVYLGTATVVRSGGDRSVAFDGYGGERDGTATTLTGTFEVTELADGSHDFVADFTHSGGVTTTFDYTGNVAGTYDGPTTWNGSGTVERSGVVAPSGVIEATTVDQVRDDASCDGESMSGETTLAAGGRIVTITYDGATACDADDSARWSVDGEDRGTITGIACSVRHGSQGSASLAASSLLALLGLLLARRRRPGA